MSPPPMTSVVNLIMHGNIASMILCRRREFIRCRQSYDHVLSTGRRAD